MAERADSTRDDARPQPRISTISRRKALTSAAAAGALLAVPTAAALARPAAMHPDVGLLALFAQWEVAAMECDKADRIMWEAEERYEAIAPKLPEAMYRQPGDDALVGYAKGWLFQNSGRYWYPPSSVATIRGYRPNPALPQRAARIAEITVAANYYEAACEAAEIATGYRDAKQHCEQANERNRDLRRRIMETRATTYDGLLAKARIYLWCYAGDTNEMDELLAEETEGSVVSGAHVAQSLAIDLARIAAALS